MVQLTFGTIIFTLLIVSSTGKIFKRCELAKELNVKHKIPKDESSIWTCIADKLNVDLNTNSSSEESVGIFAIQRKLWCAETSEETSRCGITCDKLLDDDITDDLYCVRDVINTAKTYRKKFEAWPVYEEFCQLAWKNYMKECFGGKELQKLRKSRAITENHIEDDQDKYRKVQLGVNWDTFGREPDYFFNDMFSDVPKRLKRIN